MRFISGAAGLALVGAAAHVNVIASGGYHQPAAIVTLALAVGVAVGAAVIGYAIAHGRLTLAVCIGLGLIAGESYAVLATSERVIAGRELAQVPVREAATLHEDAARRVAEARKRMQDADDAIMESPRVAAAIAAVDVANKAIREQAALPGCKANCRELLQSQADSARRELERAQSEVDVETQRVREHARNAYADAVKVLEARPMPRSATPLADRLGIEPWLLDVIAAALLSLGVNGLGGALIALAAWRPTPTETIEGRCEHCGKRASVTPEPVVAVATATPVVSLVRPTAKLIEHQPVGHVIRFIADTTEPADETIELSLLHAGYERWCTDTGSSPIDATTFETELDRLREMPEVGGRITKTGTRYRGLRLMSGGRRQAARKRAKP